MALDEATLRKLGKEELIKLALEYQSKFDSTLSSISDIKADLSELRRHYEKLESELLVTKQVNTKLCDQMKLLERQCWANAWRYLVFLNLSVTRIWRGKF